MLLDPLPSTAEDIDTYSYSRSPGWVNFSKDSAVTTLDRVALKTVKNTCNERERPYMWISRKGW
jgi:hypothetical protein